ncbi:ABC transporter ATP-binding protein [Flavobacterium sp. W21_SRS_FM6]|uniref:ABC transporter ATP-binding protein n=1 Tax=Flavobacterium sp. W21_SRS_FM6 TaxID=3240268 RepID=UPI003F93BBE6
MELEVQQICKQYAQVQAINRLSFGVKKGEIFALLGPNGAGKSSLIRMLSGFTQADSGQIKVSISNRYYPYIPSHALGYLPEDRGLYPEKSVLKNIVYFAQLNGVDKMAAIKEAKYWLERFDLLDRIDAQLKSLSKGNQQKVQLITAVIHQPSWVILDEPFSGLDPINQEKVVQFLAELKAKGMTVILSAHQMAMVEKLADRMLLLNKGQCVFYGTLHAIRQQAKVSGVLTAKFSENIDEKRITSLLEDSAYQLIDSHTLRINLSNQHVLNDLLLILPGLGELVSLHSEKLDLHQLYLSAIANHGEANSDK